MRIWTKRWVEIVPKGDIFVLDVRYYRPGYLWGYREGFVTYAEAHTAKEYVETYR